jgi:hypothetical protein
MLLALARGDRSRVRLALTQPSREATALGDGSGSASRSLGLCLRVVAWLVAEILIVRNDIESTLRQRHYVVLNESHVWPTASALRAPPWWASTSVLCPDCAVALGSVALSPRHVMWSSRRSWSIRGSHVCGRSLALRLRRGIGHPFGIGVRAGGSSGIRSNRAAVPARVCVSGGRAPTKRRA